MEKQKAFDLAKKLLDGGDIHQGYRMNDGRLYPAYYTNEEWEAFLADMKTNYPAAFKGYDEGKGGELEEHNFKGKKIPPKMASYSSSSRFIYELSRNIPGFEFECKLPISIPANNGGEAEASLDGYYPKRNIFVEAKCHEFYKPSFTSFKFKYREFYDFLKERLDFFDYRIATRASNNGKISREVVFQWNGVEIHSYDLKQVLCHLLGIAKFNLTNKVFGETTFLYLVYKPTQSLLNYVEAEEGRKSIEDAWDLEKQEAISIDYRQLYGQVVHYLHEKKGIAPAMSHSSIEQIIDAFSFRFCDQDLFLNLFSE